MISSLLRLSIFLGIVLVFCSVVNLIKVSGADDSILRGGMISVDVAGLLGETEIDKTIGEAIDSGCGLVLFRARNIRELEFCFTRWEQSFPDRANHVIAKFNSIEERNRDFFDAVIVHKTQSDCFFIVFYQDN